MSILDFPGNLIPTEEDEKVIRPITDYCRTVLFSILALCGWLLSA